MFDPELQSRMAQLWLDAMVGYSRAATNAYAVAFERSMDVWSNALRQPPQGVAALPAVTWPVAPYWGQQQLNFWGGDQRSSSPSWSLWGWPQQTWPQPSMPNPMNLWTAWASLTPGANPWRTATSVWPMVVVMMAYGVPREVAIPAAEANAAVMDAKDIATKSAERVFSSYRSEGGHASAQIIWLKNLTAMMALLPFGAGTLPNWTFPTHTFG